MTKKLRVSVNSLVLLVAVGALVGRPIRRVGLLGPPALRAPPLVLGMFAACCLATDLWPRRRLRRERSGAGHRQLDVHGGHFAGGPAGRRHHRSATTVVIGDVIARKAVVKVLYNATQVTVCLSLGAAILVAAGQDDVLRLAGTPRP